LKQINESLRAPARRLQLGMLTLTRFPCRQELSLTRFPCRQELSLTRFPRGQELVIGEFQRRLTLIEGVPRLAVGNFDAAQMSDVFSRLLEVGGERHALRSEAPH
jgi:hypothetical protein